LVEIVADAIEQGILRWRRGGKGPRKWIGHREASACASEFVRGPGGGERRTRDEKRSSPDWLPENEELPLRAEKSFNTEGTESTENRDQRTEIRKKKRARQIAPWLEQKRFTTGGSRFR
jgi:hypothetical protein